MRLVLERIRRLAARPGALVLSAPAYTYTAATNLRKHGVSFDEATTVFADRDALDGVD